MERQQSSPVKGKKRQSNASPTRQSSSVSTVTISKTSVRKSTYYEEQRGIKQEIIDVDHLKQIIQTQQVQLATLEDKDK